MASFCGIPRKQNAEYLRKWRAANPDKVKAYNRTRIEKARKKREEQRAAEADQKGQE